MYGALECYCGNCSAEELLRKLHTIHIFTAISYFGFSNNEAVEKVLAGYRMPKPEECVDEIYAMVMECWEHEPENRPTFAELVEFFSKLTGENTIDEGLYTIQHEEAVYNV